MSTFQTGLTSNLSLSKLGKPGGFAPLGVDGRVPSIHLPSAIAGGLKFITVYNASTNTPDLSDSNKKIDGDLYIVNISGEQDIGNGLETFSQGDAVFYSTVEDKWYVIESTTLGLEVTFDPSGTSLSSSNIQDVIIELNSKINSLSGNFRERKPLAESFTIYIDYFIGNNNNTGFSEQDPLQTTIGLNRLLKFYDWGDNTVRIILKDFVFVVDIDFSHIDGIQTCIFEGDVIGLLSIYNFSKHKIIIRNCNFTANANLKIFNCSSVKIENSTWDSILTDRFCTVYNTDFIEILNITLTNVNNQTFLFIENSGVVTFRTSFFNNVSCNPLIKVKGFLSLINLINYSSLNITGSKFDFSELIGILSITDNFNITESIPTNYSDLTIVNGSDYDNTSSGLTSTTKSEAIDELVTMINGSSSSSLPLHLQTERTTLTSNRTLTNSDKGILNIEINDSNFNTITLPTTPDINKKYIIKNRESSSFDLNISGFNSLAPGHIWEGVYDGVEWIVI